MVYPDTGCITRTDEVKIGPDNTSLRFRTCPICGQVKHESDFRIKAYLDDKLVRICSLCAARASNNPYTGFLHG